MKDQKSRLNKNNNDQRARQIIYQLKSKNNKKNFERQKKFF